MLKIKLDEENRISHSELNAIRNEVSSICMKSDVRIGHKTQKRYGVYNSVYKWRFDFRNEDFAEIMEQIDIILNSIHTSLISL